MACRQHPRAPDAVAKHRHVVRPFMVSYQADAPLRPFIFQYHDGAVLCKQPCHAARQRPQPTYVIVLSLFLLEIRQHVNKLRSTGIEQERTSRHQTPDAAPTTGIHRVDPVRRHVNPVTTMRLKVHELIAVVTIQPVVRGKPHHAVVVPDNTVHRCHAVVQLGIVNNPIRRLSHHGRDNQ